MKTDDERIRIVIEHVTPEIDAGRFPIKRTVGEKVVVEADIFADGHDEISCVLLYRKYGEPEWFEIPMISLVNDRRQGSFAVTDLGRYQYGIQAWVDRFKTWQKKLNKKLEAGQDVSVDLLEGARIVREAALRASGSDAGLLLERAAALNSQERWKDRAIPNQFGDLADLMSRYPDKRSAATYDTELSVVVDREKAGFSSWYEMFPRSCADKPGRHATLRECEARLPYIAQMGFDVLYLPPIHPIGFTDRKGKNNISEAGSGDTGSPWAIGSEAGGHRNIHPDLGTPEDFLRFMDKAKDYGIEIALDLAFQCSPDHPYVREHPEWFRTRPDGTIQYSENPPKKYEDIFPLDFETENWKSLWEELKGVVLFWIEQGVRIFRVDNPHTKPFPFWECLINEIKKKYPEVVFLAEAFTRPKVMYRLAKLGFTQSYTYFAWRNTSSEISRYFEELTQTEASEFFRPNLWPNTPDILTEYLQIGGRPAFMSRLVLAATLGANYGIYGPAFELCEARPRGPGEEEYLNSEKYEIRHWDIERPDSLKDFIARINRIRKENPALQSDRSLRFHPSSNDQLICYSKQTTDRSNIILVVVNLDPHHTHAAWMDIPLVDWGLDPLRPYQVHDLVSDARYLWKGSRNYVETNPAVVPAHIFRIRRRVRTERDFDYFM
ncbi:MAG: alpha-1,4-glucan--maltose-1-phosphate maltosyltransferase [Deltaproteobacteria bacterium]|nr:alpha-1,4-glucan--maltose-1-phosphate maltosyltransferase [Deltaproteobacteria bacterium]